MNEKYQKSLFCNEGGTPLSQNTKIILLDIGCQYNGDHKNHQLHTQECVAISIALCFI